jgi:uncharacterized protein
MKALALRVGIPLLGIAVLLASPSPAEPCSCQPPVSALQARAAAAAVFLGRVESVLGLRPGMYGLFESRVFRFRVSRAWKGVSSEYVDVETAEVGTACGYPFEVGEEYLVYAYGEPTPSASVPGQRPGTSACTRTAHFSEAEERDLRELGVPVWTSGRAEGPILSEELLRASSEGDTEAVRRLLAAGNDVNGRDRRHRMTALKAAAFGGHVATVRLLLAAGARVDESKGGQTALDDALAARQPDVARVLLAAGARPSPLSLVLATGDPPDVVEALLARGAPVRGQPGRDALFYAADRSDVAMIRRLLSAGAEPDSPFPAPSALDTAVARGNLEIVRLLLAAGARPRQETLDRAAAAGRPDVLRLVQESRPSGAESRPGPMALLLAAQASNVAAIDLALASGVDVNAREGGTTPLVHAARSGSAEVVRRLLKAGANPNLPGADGVRPLMAAAMSGREGVLPLLVEAGADLEAQWSTEGRNAGTALYFAVTADRVENVTYLLKAGARPNAPLDGILYGTILSEAVARRRVDVARLLIGAGADVNARRTVGFMTPSRFLESPPLTVAAERGDAAMVQLLLDAGARIDTRDAVGRTALERAQEAGNTAAIEVLRKASGK